MLVDYRRSASYTGFVLVRRAASLWVDGVETGERWEFPALGHQPRPRQHCPG